MTTPDLQPTVFVVEDDPGMRSSLLRLLKSSGLTAIGFASAAAFLEDWSPAQPGCVVSDVWMPDMTGLELQALLLSRGADVPMVLISARPLVPDVVHAIQRGAIDFLEKPFRDDELLERVRQALEADARRRERASRGAQIEARFARLTDRERQVTELLASGLSTKRVASKLGISSKTADVHRARVLEKLEVDSVVELLKLVHERDDLSQSTDRGRTS